MSDERQNDPDFVVLPRAALFEFLGEVALPPWTDHNGKSKGGSIDCAPIAEHLTTWVADNDLSSLFLGAGSESVVYQGEIP